MDKMQRRQRLLDYFQSHPNAKVTTEQTILLLDRNAYREVRELSALGWITPLDTWPRTYQYKGEGLRLDYLDN